MPFYTNVELRLLRRCLYFHSLDVICKQGNKPVTKATNRLYPTEISVAAWQY